MVDEGLLHWMQWAVLWREAFDGRDRVAIDLSGHRETGRDTAAIDVNRTRPALSVIAALLGSGQPKFLAKEVEQRHAGVNLQGMLLPIYDKAYGYQRGRL